MEFPPLLSLVPYPFLPPVNGGHLGIAEMHRHLAQYCEDHLAGTASNAPRHPEPFVLHKVFDAGGTRYLPFRYHRALVGIGRTHGVKAIFCEHPYMALSAQAVARALRVPWYLRNHNIESERFRAVGKPWWPLLARYEKWAFRQAAGAFFVTAEDAHWAAQHGQIPASKCHIAPYGTPLTAPPAGNREAARQRLCQALNLRPDVPWLYFLGALDYRPNVEAVDFILRQIQPRLQASGQAFELLIAGKGLQPQQERALREKGIRYTGFLPSLDDLLLASDVMLNPVLTGGGIKTKAVEALAWGKRVVSCHSGAAGLDRTACGPALSIAADNDWDAFNTNLLRAIHTPATAGPAFYQMYYWGNVARNVLQTIFE